LGAAAEHPQSLQRSAQQRLQPPGTLVATRSMVTTYQRHFLLSISACPLIV